MQYQEQDQGWSRTAKVTAALAAVGVLGGAAAYFGLDLGDEVESAAEKFSGSWDTAVDEAGNLSQNVISKFGDTLGEIANKIEGVDSSNYDLTSLKDPIAHAGDPETKGIGSLFKEILEKGGNDAYEAAAKAAEETGIKIDGLIDDGKNLITGNPKTSIGVAVGGAGLTGYVAGRSSGARACEHGHAHA